MKERKLEVLKRGPHPRNVKHLRFFSLFFKSAPIIRAMHVLMFAPAQVDMLIKYLAIILDAS